LFSASLRLQKEVSKEKKQVSSFIRLVILWLIIGLNMYFNF
jgi:hypothetical protein